MSDLTSKLRAAEKRAEQQRDEVDGCDVWTVVKRRFKSSLG